jgi:ribosome maturation factor RimP
MTTKSNLEEQIYTAIIGHVNALGFDIVTLQATNDKIIKITILIDKIDESIVVIENCVTVSRHISTLLDVAELISGNNYTLEVSSAGVERPLIKLDDYKKFIGRPARIHLTNALDGRSKYSGKILSVEDSNISLALEDNDKDKNRIFTISFNEIKKANLVFTDELFKQLMKQGKKV